MRKRFRTLIVLASTVAMVLMLNVGTALARHAGDPTDWTCTSNEGTIIGECTETTDLGIAAQNALGPVFNNAPANDGRFVGIDKNPLCLLHNLGDRD